MYIFLSVCWLLVTVGLFVWYWSDPENSLTRIWGTGIPVGWLALVMLAYNLLRWWSNWQLSRPRQEYHRPPVRPVVYDDDDKKQENGHFPPLGD
jgi:hypothetical protein